MFHHFRILALLVAALVLVEPVTVPPGAAKIPGQLYRE
jgi:hypothetical protein